MNNWICQSPDLAPRSCLTSWVTWLAKPLSDPSQCLVPLYVQSRFKVAKEDVYMGDWAAKHSEIMESIGARMSSKGRPFKFEQDVSIVSKTGVVIVGSIDVWSPEHEGAPAFIADAKTGKPKVSDRLQVNLYQLITKASPEFALSNTASGLIKYKTGQEVWIKPEEAGSELAQRLFQLLKVVASDSPPATVPSKANCKFCPIRHLCPDVTTETHNVPVTNLF